MGNDTILEAIGKGNIKATMQVGGKLSHTTITQVLHVPKMKNSFISVSKLISNGFKMEFDKEGCKVNNARGVVVAKARWDMNLYLLNVKVRKNLVHIVILWMKVRCFGMKDLAISTWQALRSWMPWWMT